jgi:ATP-dependent RNA helicase DeaD
MPFPAVHPALERALAERGYAEPTPVQAAVLEDGLTEQDLLVSAQTGSGKTVAFGLAAAPTLLGDQEQFLYATAPLALVIAPTRELAMQVSTELTWLYAGAKGRIVTCVGGMDARREQRVLAQGCHIVVGTPGRLKDHIERGNLDLSSLKLVVLDEADEMLDMGFREDLEFILDATPEDRRTLLFSATIAREIANLARKYQRDAVRIDTTSKNTPHGDIEYRAMRIAPNEIEHAVVNILRFFEAPGALVFCSTRESVRHLQSSLLERGFNAVALSGEMGQRERTDALQSLRDGRARVCVATDVAARGLDLPDLGLVIHAELPMNRQGLLHRSGRTGRAGKKGVSILLVPHTRRRKADMLIGNAGIDVTWSGAPTSDEIRAKDETRLLSGDIFAVEPSEEDLALAQRLLAERTPEAIAAALIRLQRKDLPAPEELLDPGDRGPARAQRAAGDTAAQPWPGERLQPDEVTWFRMDVGRSRNADPKWLIPLICRLGHITKKEIGSIRVYPEETRFGIANTHAAKFASAVKGSTEKDVRIEPSEAPQPGGYKTGPKPHGGSNDGAKPAWQKKPYVKREAAADGEAPRAFTREDRPARPDGAPPFKKKPYAPRTDRAEGEAAPAKKPYNRDDRPASADGPRPPFKKKKPFAKANGAPPGKKPFAKKPFKAKARP